MNMYVIDIEKIVRDEVRKAIAAALENVRSVPPTQTSRKKQTRVDIIRNLGLNESYTFRCPKGKVLSNFRDSADGLARYVGRRYGARYRTHRVDGGLQVTRIA